MIQKGGYYMTNIDITTEDNIVKFKKGKKYLSKKDGCLDSELWQNQVVHSYETENFSDASRDELEWLVFLFVMFVCVMGLISILVILFKPELIA